MNPCTAIVYNQTDNNMAVGSLQAADIPAHDSPVGLFAITDATGNLVEGFCYSLPPDLPLAFDVTASRIL